jgi:hypothetical protein
MDMSEQPSLTAEEARDLVNKLNSLAGELSPAQRQFLQSALAAGGESNDVEGHMFGTGSGSLHTILFCPTIACTVTFGP